MNTTRVQAFLNETVRLEAALLPTDDVYRFRRTRYYELSAIEPKVVGFLHTASTENRRAEKLRSGYPSPYTMGCGALLVESKHR